MLNCEMGRKEGIVMKKEDGRKHSYITDVLPVGNFSFGGMQEGATTSLVCEEIEELSAGTANSKNDKTPLQQSEGLDGILVTIGLCIIALLLCVVMKTSLTGFIQTLVSNMTEKAQSILQTSSAVVFLWFY